MSRHKLKYITGRVNVLNKYNSPDYSGEWEGGGTFRFKLLSPVEFTDVNGKRVVYTHIELEIGGWSETPAYVNSNKNQRLIVRPLSNDMWRDMYEALYTAETGNGQLKDWCFSDDIYQRAYPKVSPQ